MDYGSGNDSLSGSVIAAANGEGWGEREEGGWGVVRVMGKVGWMDLEGGGGLQSCRCCRHDQKLLTFLGVIFFHVAQRVL